MAITQTGQAVSWSLALKVVLCMVFARSAAMAFNRWADRSIDKKNPRTTVREIPSGQISSSAAFLFVIINCVAFIVTTYFINQACFYLSFVALAVILGYSYTKRYTSLCHLVLGLGLSLAPIGAWIAVTGEFAVLPLLLSGAVACWISGIEFIHAMLDQQSDRSQQLHSIPSLLGTNKALLLSRVLHIISSLFLLRAGFYGMFNLLYFVGWAVFTGLLIYQHRLVKPGDLSKVNLAFFTTNGIASITFAVIVITSLLM